MKRIKFLLSFLFLSISNSMSTTPLIYPEKACNSTSDPSFCTTLFPPHVNHTIYTYARISVRKSLKNTLTVLKKVDQLLSLRPTLPHAIIRALDDCHDLMSRNVDFLQISNVTLHRTDTGLQTSEADKLRSFLSALLTNQQTCSDGLEAMPLTSLRTLLLNGRKVHSVSLALFNKASWDPCPSHGSARVASMPARIPKISWMRRERNLNALLDETGDPILVNDIVVVSKDGMGNFTTIGDAIAFAPNKNTVKMGYFLIYVVEGLYEEYVVVPKTKKYVMIVGDGINKTVITGNHSAGDGWTTFASATLVVNGEGFVATGITIRNTADINKGQAVAMRSSADLSAFYKCSFEGNQDTLYSHSLRQFYRECDIYGTIDFIFGNAAVVLQNCNVYPTIPKKIGLTDVITAQGRIDPNQNTGISMQNCTFKASLDVIKANISISTYLGRPWKLYSRTVIMQSFMDCLINPLGWSPMNGSAGLDKLYYGEYDNYGPGSGTLDRVHWPGFHVLNEMQAINFTVANFLFGDVWLPESGVPFYSGLI